MEDEILVMTASAFFTNIKLVKSDIDLRHDQSFIIIFKSVKPSVYKLVKHMIKNIAAYPERFLTSVWPFCGH